jgi:alpha-beta hydrolase superfamily lysophospholipase
VARTYHADRLVHQVGTPRFYLSMLEAMEETANHDHGLPVPLCFLLPMQEKVVCPKTTLKYFHALKQDDKELKTYPDFYHESFNEIGKEKVFEDICAWIQKNSSRS